MSGDAISVKRKQRWMFASGIGVAAVPIAVQVIAAIVIWNDPKAFPLADDAIGSKAFWILQAILLCVAVGGSTVVDCIRVGRPKSDHRPSFVFEAVLLILLLIVISVIVALALLDKALPNAVYYVVAFVSLVDLGLAYRVEMDLALIDAGYL